MGKNITGYEKAGDVYITYNGESGPNPLFGHGPDFGYFYYGAIWYGDEIWDNARPKEDYNQDGELDELDQLIWDERENQGRGFVNWTAFNHPTLGEVEIGGWDPKFFSQNAPSGHMENWVKNEALFNVAMLKHLPKLEWSDCEVKKIKSYRSDSTDYKVKVAYKNIGKLPTALRQADLVKIVKPDRLNISFVCDEVSDESVSYKVLNESLKEKRGRRYPGMPAAKPGNNYYKETGYAPGESTQVAEFTIRVYGSEPVKMNAALETTRAGQLAEREIVIQ